MRLKKELYAHDTWGVSDICKGSPMRILGDDCNRDLRISRVPTQE